MNLRTISAALALAGLVLGTTSCKDFFNVNVDPLHPTQAELGQLLPVTQTAMATHLGMNIQGLGQPTSGLMQQLSNGRGIGAFGQGGDSFTTPWNGLYTDMLANNELIITQGTEKQQWGYVGIAQLQKAYVFSQLVDLFGDIPYSQALKGAQLLYPRYDKDVDVYNGNTGQGIQSLFSLIDDGIANLNKGTGGPGPSDLIYGGTLSSWTEFGRTLKLKLYVQIRKTRADGFAPEVGALLLGTPGTSLLSKDFEFRYGASESPANRNIGFLADYANPGRENFVGRYFYLLMKYGDGTNSAPNPPPYSTANPTPFVRPFPSTAFSYVDPRLPYYFFNQQTDPKYDPTSFDYQDINDGRFVTFRQGSRGPAANSATSAGTRTMPGLYPYGGRFNDGRGGIVNGSFGRGVVAQRLLPYFSRKFLEAEAQLTILNNRSAARAALGDAIQASFDKVNAIASAEGTSPTPTPDTGLAYPTAILSGFRALAPIPAAEATAYITAALQRFDGNTAGGTPIKTPLQIIMEEKYVASFGMGVDIFTDWRRTGFPIITVPDNANIGSNGGLLEDGDQLTTSSGLFPRRFFYPQQDLTSNLNPTAPKVQVDPLSANYRIFWDR